MIRKLLTDKQWNLISPLLPGKVSDPGRTGIDNRRSIEGILWIVRTGARWRDLPPYFGNWNTVHRRFRRWVKAGVFDRIFEATHGSLDLKTVQVDGSFVKVHQHATGAKKAEARPMDQPEDRPLGDAGAGLHPS